MMSKTFLPLTIVLVLLSAPVVAQQVLFQNPYDPNGIGGGGLGPDANGQSATVITLENSSTIYSVSFTVQDVRAQPEGFYFWSVYSDVNGMPSGVPGPISGPTGLPTYMPIVSGQTEESSWYPIVPPVNNLNSTNEVTINTGPVTLGAGNYFFALTSSGPENSAESWLSGAYNTGNASSFAGGWNASSPGGNAIIVVGTSAPEINSSSAIGALTLLFGGLMVLRGRRPAKANHSPLASH
jgi:hypothetical protein